MPLVPAKFAGTGAQGSFYEAPDWVDIQKQPGTTVQTVPSLAQWIWGYIKMDSIFWSPNLVWLLFAIGVYVFFPYDIEAAKTWSWDWVLFRAKVNVILVFVYFGWWHLTLYRARWAERKFDPKHMPGSERMIHNMWYCFLGAVQWTGWECLMLRAYALGKMPYIADEVAWATRGNIARMVLGTILVPFWRDIHFYVAHRFIHIKPLYKYVHSLHHRNTDIEPFAGLCMHPIEHLYYFSCIWPSLYILGSPFHFLWNGVHLLISPAASHSGWEDHFQSDQYHYLHHRYFECNYGTSGTPFDWFFGTFRECMGESKQYTGAAKTYKGDASHSEKTTKMVYKRHDGFDLYMLISSLFFVCVALAATKDALEGYPIVYDLACCLAERPYQVAFLMSFGPVILGTVLMKMTGDKASLLWPFHKENLTGWLGIHILVAVIISVLPVYHQITAALAPTSFYCDVWGC